MSLRTMIESTPLGATLLVSNGKPRPPERFNRKLSNWNRENYVGTLVASRRRRATSRLYGREGSWRIARLLSSRSDIPSIRPRVSR